MDRAGEFTFHYYIHDYIDSSFFRMANGDNGKRGGETK